MSIYFLVGNKMSLEKMAFLALMCMMTFAVLKGSELQDKMRVIDLVTSQMTWWSSAGTGCGAGHLFVPNSSSVEEQLIGQLNEDTTYWVGGTRQLEWIWTEDNTPLYEYQGLVRVSTDVEENLDANSPWSCHSECGDDYSVIGLKGSECYCLQDVNNERLNTTESEHLCSGNYNTFCGNSEGISVYKIKALNFDPTAKGACAYAWKTRSGKFSLHAAECGTEYQYICNGDSLTQGSCRGNACVSKDKKTWWKANDSCLLTKVVESAVSNLTNLMKRKQFNLKYIGYWVGLRQQQLYKSVTGEDLDSELCNLRESDGNCLALDTSMSPPYMYVWRDCEEEYPSICEKAPPTTSKTFAPTTSSASEQTTSPDHITTTSASTNMSGEQTTLVEDTITLTSNDGPDPDTMNVIYTTVAVICGIVLLIGLISLEVFHRKKKFCFKVKPTMAQRRGNDAISNAAYFDVRSSDSIGDENSQYISPVADESRNFLLRPGLTGSDANGLNNDQESNLGGSDYNIAGQFLNITSAENAYDHTVNLTDFDDYDRAGAVARTLVRSDYDHTELKTDKLVDHTIKNTAKEIDIYDNSEPSDNIYTNQHVLAAETLPTSTDNTSTYYNLNYM